MKNLVFVIILVLNFINSFSETVPLIKVYMIDGNPIEYKIAEISDMSFISTNLSYTMTVYQLNGIPKSDYDIRTIDSIKFEKNELMLLSQFGKTKSLIINEIDSIIFTFNTCNEIQIGNQIWMCKNLDVSHYRNGDSIPEVRDPVQWKNLKTGAWCYYKNDPKYGAIYGKLYNWYAVNDPRGLAPDGWHVPSDYEWQILSTYLGGDSLAGGMMKETGTSHWSYTDNFATNSSGFSGLPGGFCYEGHNAVGSFGNWWTSTVFDNSYSWYRYLGTIYTSIFRNYANNVRGCSVRCIKDE